MRSLSLEDFGAVTNAEGRSEEKPSRSEDRYEDGYNAGWDDAVAKIEADQKRISGDLANGLVSLVASRGEAVATLVDAMEPALRDIFDKLLPHAAERAFFGILMEELRSIAQAGNDRLSLIVAFEDVPAVERLMAESDLGSLSVEVVGEPVLSMSQALIRWPGQERRIDLEEVLAALDESLEALLGSYSNTVSSGPSAALSDNQAGAHPMATDSGSHLSDMPQKEAING